MADITTKAEMDKTASESQDSGTSPNGELDPGLLAELTRALLPYLGPY